MTALREVTIVMAITGIVCGLRGYFLPAAITLGAAVVISIVEAIIKHCRRPSGSTTSGRL